MTDERIKELFFNVMDHYCNVDTEKCIDFLKEIGITKQEAKELEFYDFVCESLPETYD